MKDDETKNAVFLRDGLKESIASHSSTFNTFVRNEVRELAAKEKDIDYKNLSQEIFSYGFNFLERYGTPYRFLKNLIANKISINTANDDQRDFVFNLMKGYNISSFFEKKSETRDLDRKNLYEKSRFKALDILLKCEKNVEGIKKFLPKRFNKDITEDQKSILLNAMKLFDIKNTIVSLFKNDLIRSLDYQNTVKLEQKTEFEESVAERTKIRRQRKSDDNHTTDMPELQSEESAAQGKEQKAKGLKILTPNQMLSRLLISLAQLNAGNNSEKLKNEIRQLLYSLHRSKKLTKTSIKV